MTVQSDRIITIDGPAGSGKSTLARNLAQALGWRHLDTGAIYRAVAVSARELMVEDPEEAVLLAASLDIRLDLSGAASRVWLGEREVTGLLREPSIAGLTSKLSSLPGVRAALMEVQRRQGDAGNLVAEGRDMGTVVFPLAGLKFFLTADPKVRAARRHLQLVSDGRQADPETILASIIERDTLDSGRDDAPLRVAPGAVVIDSTAMSPFEVETLMLGEAAKVFRS
jgi:cytidylate kinase